MTSTDMSGFPLGDAAAGGYPVRRLGRTELTAGAIGIGTWAMGGPCFSPSGSPIGWGAVDDDESVAAVRRAMELGATLIDTADVYGAGHAEEVVGRAVAGHRDEVLIATKWGNRFDPVTRVADGQDDDPGYVRQAVLGSLGRLGTDRVDILQLHIRTSVGRALDLAAQCEALLDEGLIRAYGWSTDDPARIEAFATAGRAGVVQHELSVLHDNAVVLDLCERYDLGSLNRSPLAMGLLSPKFTADSVLPADDVRGMAPEWLRWFRDGRPSPRWLARRDAVADVLTSSGRSLVQGALAWICARSQRSIPIPGLRTVAQAEENLGTLAKPPLTAEEIGQIAELLSAADAEDAGQD
jgi:aryl-alcohol dehydrogenase-like predicted oxidoreductase